MSKSRLHRRSGFLPDLPSQGVRETLHTRLDWAHTSGRSDAVHFTDGAARICSTLFSELRSAIFASVAQRAIRQVARNTFGHLLQMDMGFHLTRQTGGLMRAIDRGTK